MANFILGSARLGFIPGYDALAFYQQAVFDEELIG